MDCYDGFPRPRTAEDQKRCCGVHVDQVALTLVEAREVRVNPTIHHVPELGQTVNRSDNVGLARDPDLSDELIH